MSKENCSNCRFFKANDPVDTNPVGVCRIHPPKVFVVPMLGATKMDAAMHGKDVFSAYPPVKKEWWCSYHVKEI